MVKKNSKLYKDIQAYLVVTFGCILAAVGYTTLILPLDLFEGGVTGLGIIAKHVTGLPIVGMTSIAITAVVFVFATKILGRGFGAKSIYATILMNVLIDSMLILEIKPITNDVMLASFYGGAIVGAGLGLVYLSGASTGGSDAFAQIMRKLKQVSVGRTLFMVDVFVLGAALFFVGMEKIMYSFIFIYIEVTVIDIVMNGVKASQRIMIVTDKVEEIKATILGELSRGLTIYEGIGGYSGVSKKTITTVLPKKQIPYVRSLIAEVDPKAFVIIQNIHQVYGEGFEPLPKRYKKQS